MKKYAKKYAKKSKGELIEISMSRSLCSAGKRADLIARLRENDKHFENLDAQAAARFTNGFPDASKLAGRYLLYDSSIPRMMGTNSRIIDALNKNCVPFIMIDINHEAYMRMFWHREAKGRTLPAIVKQGCVIGDLGQIRRWIESDNPKKCADEACEQAGVGVEDPPGLYSEDAWFDKPLVIPDEHKHLLLIQPYLKSGNFVQNTTPGDKCHEKLKSNDS